MRMFNFEHDGTDYELAATFAASIEIADKVADPLAIAREAAMEAALAQARIPYQPKFMFTIRNVPQILFAGFRAAGSTMKLKDVEELVFDMGFIEARAKASDYLALIVSPKPTKIDEEPDEVGEEGNAQSLEVGAKT